MPRPDTLARIDAPTPDPRATPQELPPRRAAGAAMLAGVAFVLLFVVVQVIAFGVLELMDAPLPSVGGVGTGELLSVGFVHLAGIAAAVVVVVAAGAPWRRLGVGTGSFRQGWNALAPVGLLVIGPPLIAALATGDPLLDPDVDAAMLVAIVAVATTIALNEELWFRGVVLDQLASARMPWLTVLGSAVLFGLPHAFGGTAFLLNAVAVTLAVGIPFSVVRLRSGGLGPLVAWHAVIDVWAFMHTASVTPEGSPTIAGAAVALVLPALIAVGYLAWFARGMRRDHAPG